MVYLDNNATTACAPEVIDAMLPYFGKRYGNPSSMHAFGGSVARNIDAARASVAVLIGAEAQEIVFTGCGTEANNHALFGVVAALGEKASVITSAVEHPAILEPCRQLQRRGHPVTFVGVDGDGRLRMDELEKALQTAPRPTLVSIMWANNETGVVFPIAEIARLAKAAGAMVHTDAIQAVGKLPDVNVADIPVDMLSLSGHKLHAPKGIGALYVRKGTPLRPFLLGGHQEKNRRAGTENVPYIVGLGKAAELLTLEGARPRAPMHDGMAALRDRLQEGLLATCPDARVNGDQKNRLPNTLNISFEFIEGESILCHLSDAGVCASSGSACTSGSLEASHVLRAMGIPFTALHGSIRFSLSCATTEGDIAHVLSVMPAIVAKLRALSPFVK